MKPGPSQRQGWAWPSVVGSRLEAATTSMVSRRLRALHSTATAQHSHSTATAMPPAGPTCLPAHRFCHDLSQVVYVCRPRGRQG